MARQTQQRSPDVLRVLSERLPAPERVYHIDGVVFEIYKAKEQFQSHWNHAVLRTFVHEARTSFLRYGDVPLEDSFDTKAAVYLVRAKYTLSVYAPLLFGVEEWLSVRFIPAHGSPQFTEDIEACLLHGMPVRHHIARRFFASEDAALKATITASRLCGIKPYFSKQSNFPLYTDVLPKRQQHLSLSLVLLNHTFFDSVQTDQHKKEIITMMFHSALLPKVTQVSLRDTILPLPLTHVSEFFGEPQEYISIDRSLLSYAYPSYWLQVDQALHVLVALTKKRILHPRTPQHYLRTPYSFEELQKKYTEDAIGTLSHLYHLGRLFTVEGRIRGSRLTGTMLRKYLDRYVRDAPQLHVLPVDVWVAQLEHILRHVKRFTTHTYTMYGTRFETKSK